MNWLIIVLIVSAMVGSMMWMMPTPRQRVQALLRQCAMRAGLQVQLARMSLPRALGEAEPDERNCVAYRLPRRRKSGRAELVTWQIFQLQSHANVGLPEGWSWSQGEGQLSASALALIAELIQALPTDVYGLESTPINVSVYWEEQGTPETVELIRQLLNRLLEAGV